MDTLTHRLKSLGPTIVDICRISGTPGVSLGVLHKNEVIHVDNFGYRDVEGKKAPGQDTLYFVASLSKLFTAAGIGILVDEEKLEWNTPVSSILPEFDHPDDTVKTKAGIVDFLSHRSGLAGKSQMWYLEYGRPALPRRDTMRFSSYLDVVYAFQQRWLYNNWGYGLADEVTEKVSGKSWGAFLPERIFSPLGMKGTTTKVDPSTENVAKGYMALSDGTPYHLPRPKQGDGKLAEGAAGIQSNVRDLLTFYKSVMQADKEQKCGEDTSSPLKNIATITSPHISLEPETTSLERSYALGLIRTTLPGSLGVVGLNPMYVDKMPIVGKGIETPRVCIYHQGSIVPYLSSAHLLPDTNTAIVVLTNSMANNDAADWLGQLLLETVLDNPEKNDYVAIAKESAATSVALWPKMAKELEKRRRPDTPQQPPIIYVGKYYNIVGDWCIHVFEDEGILKMCFQGQRDESYRLAHYRYDEFSWLLTRDEDVRRGRFPVVNLEFYILSFRAAGDGGEMQQLIWRHDPDVPAGETFYRHPPK
ncbi:MAG: hypothetical protein Q9223_007501 [Gallowayella weberi]